MIAMPNADSHNARVLQEDNTDLAYEAFFYNQTKHIIHTSLTWRHMPVRSLRASSRCAYPNHPAIRRSFRTSSLLLAWYSA